MTDDIGYAFAIGESKGAYRGVTLRRALVLFANGTLVDLFQVETKKKHTVDWTLHTTGAMIVDAEGEECGKLGEDEEHGYPRMRDEKRRAVFSDVTWTALDGGAPVETHLIASPSTKENLYTATGLGHRLDEQAPMLIRRREKTKSTIFAAVHSPTPHEAATWKIVSETESMISLAGTIDGKQIELVWNGNLKIKIDAEGGIATQDK